MCKLVTSWMKLCRTQLVTEWLAVAGTLSLWGVFPQTQCHNLSCNISWPLEWLNKQDKGPFDHIWLFQLFFLFARHSSLPAPWYTFVKSLTIAKSFRSLSHSSYWVQRVGRLDKTGSRIKLLPKPPPIQLPQWNPYHCGQGPSKLPSKPCSIPLQETYVFYLLRNGNNFGIHLHVWRPYTTFITGNWFVLFAVCTPLLCAHRSLQTMDTVEAAKHFVDCLEFGPC